MSKDINISGAEWTVMEYLWREPMATITDIRKGLSDTGWSDSTIKTLVRRLVAKEAVAADDSQGNFRYRPLMSEQECRSKETRSFIDRVYQGSVSMMMTNLAADSALSEKETRKLLSLIEKMGKG